VKFGSGSRRREVQMDLTPMIDVVFQLVLFFTVTTNFVTETHEQDETIQVDLPRADAAQVSSGEGAVHVWVAVDGTLAVEDERTDLAGLRARLGAASAADPETLVILRADGGAPHGQVVAVMDLARALGLTRLAIATTPGEAGAPPP
jgi:biopolymer transport protein ExbD